MKPIKYYVMFDLELTCSEGNSFSESDSSMEIIEIGAVKITPEFDIIHTETFKEFCKPKNNPIISSYCNKLTNIKQEDIESALSFQEVYSRFIEWSGQPLLWTAWGNDYKALVREISNPFPERRYFDARDFVKLMRGKVAQSMNREINSYKLDLNGLQRHRALDDSLITCKILKEVYLRSRGFIL